MINIYINYSYMLIILVNLLYIWLRSVFILPAFYQDFFIKAFFPKRLFICNKVKHILCSLKEFLTFQIFKCASFLRQLRQIQLQLHITVLLRYPYGDEKKNTYLTKSQTQLPNTTWKSDRFFLSFVINCIFALSTVPLQQMSHFILSAPLHLVTTDGCSNLLSRLRCKIKKKWTTFK